MLGWYFGIRCSLLEDGILLMRIDSDLPRTNNFIEGWHNGFQSHVGASHPNIYKFLEVLRKEENLTRIKLKQLELGMVVHTTRRVYVQLHIRLKNITQRFEDVTKINYLRSIAHSLTF